MKKFFALTLACLICLSVSACSLPTVSENSKTITEIESKAQESKEESKQQAPTAAKVGQTVTGDKWAISLLYAKVFSEISDGTFTTKPETEGNVYLVLFFEVENVSSEDDYFNYLYIESYVDSYNTGLSVLFTNPDGYDTLTGNVAAGKKLKGCLAWEVSADWKELEVSYKDGVWTSDKAATFVVTPADLTE